MLMCPLLSLIPTGLLRAEHRTIRLHLILFLSKCSFSFLIQWVFTQSGNRRESCLVCQHRLESSLSHSRWDLSVNWSYKFGMCCSQHSGNRWPMCTCQIGYYYQENPKDRGPWWGYSPWGRKDTDMIEWLREHQQN